MDRIETVIQALARGEDRVVGDGKLADTRQHGGDHPMQPPSRREQPIHVPPDDVRQRQEPNRLRRRSAVDDHDVVVPRGAQRFDLGQREQLIEAREHRELFGLDRLDPGPVEHLQQPIADLRPVLLEPLPCIDLLRRTPRRHLDRYRSELHVERVTQRVGRIRGGDHDGTTIGCEAQRGGGRGRGLADAALTGDEQDPHRRDSDVSEPGLSEPGLSEPRRTG